MKVVKDLEHKFCEEQKGVFSPEKRRLGGDPITVTRRLTGGCGHTGLGLLSQQPETGQEDSLKLCQRFRLEMRRNSFTKRIIRHWNRVPKEVMESPYLKESRIGCSTWV